QASPITSITGTYASATALGSSRLVLEGGVVTTGGALAGSGAKGLVLDFSTFLANPGPVGVQDHLGTSTFYMGGPAVGDTLFAFNGPLSLSAGPGSIAFTGLVDLQHAPAGVDLSAFANG